MTTRDISAVNLAATRSKVVRPILFVRFAFVSGVKRYHTEIGPLTAVHPVHGSEVYQGIGSFGGISGNVQQKVSNTQPDLTLGVSGVDSSLVNIALDSSDYFQRDVEIMLGFNDENHTLLDDPVVLFSGFMNVFELSLDANKFDMQLGCSSRGAKLRSASSLRFTDETLQYEYSGDLAGEYIFRMQDIQLKVGPGTAQASTTNRGYVGRIGISG